MIKIAQQIFNIYRNSLSGLSVDVWKISILMFINRSGLMVMPFLSIYLTSQLDFTLIEAGWAGTAYGLGSVFASLLGGAMVDRFGYQRVIQYSLLAGAIAFWVLLFADKFLVFCSLMFFGSLMIDMLRPAVMSSIKILSKKENQTRGISLLRMAINLGIALGPAIGGVLAYKAGFHWLFILNGATSFVAFLFFIIFIKNKGRQSFVKPKIESKTSAYRDYYYLYLLFILLILNIAFLQIIFTVPLYFKEVFGMTEFQVGLFFTLNGLLIVFFEMPIVHFYEKRNNFATPILVGNILMFLAFLFLFIPGYWLIPFLLYSLFIGIGEIYNLPFFASLALHRSTDANSGSYMDLLSLIFSLALTIGPIFGSYVVEQYGFICLWCICAGMCLLSTILFFLSKDKFLNHEQ